MPFMYQCLDCDSRFYSEKDPGSLMQCPECRTPKQSVNLMADSVPESGWIDACFHPEREDVFRVKLSDNSERYASWNKALKGWLVDLPDGYKPGDPIPFDVSGVMYYRELLRPF